MIGCMDPLRLEAFSKSFLKKKSESRKYSCTKLDYRWVVETDQQLGSLRERIINLSRSIDNGDVGR